MQRRPSNHCNGPDLDEEHHINEASVEILLQKHNAHKVYHTRGNLYQKHLETEIVDLKVKM